jgi:NADPH:quinone reductase-like Zn-dependent oxidoreductase
MNRIQYHRYGGPEQMGLEEYQLPPLAADEILVRVKASSVNPVDWKLRSGSMKFVSGRRFPRAMGIDFSGVVEGVGASATRLRAGDEVFGMMAPKPSGAFAETLITKENLAVKKPASLTHMKAAALPLAGVTAWRALVDKANLQPGQMLLVNGAFGGVGQAAVRIARSLGARVTGRVGTAALADAKTLGLDSVLDYTKEIPAALQKSFDVVFDCNGSLTPSQADALIKSRGVVIDIVPSPYKFVRSLYSPRHKFALARPNADVLQKIADLAAAGILSISIGRTAPLKEAIAMIADLEAGRHCKGKAVIIME